MTSSRLAFANSLNQTSMTKIVGQFVGLPGAPNAVLPTSVGYFKSFKTCTHSASNPFAPTSRLWVYPEE
jgi:hypothetical protein